MNIIFMGTPSFAIPSLDILYKSNHKILAVVTVPDKPKGRGLAISESEVKQYAIRNSISILQPQKLSDETFISQIKEINPDLIVVVAFRILPPSVFNIPEFGSINLHASLLPKYRGAAPINWALINGEKETGVTTFFLREKVDTGNIILQYKYDIQENENAGALSEKLSILGAEVLIETVELIEKNNGKPQVIEQKDIISTPAPKLTPELCRIIWSRSAENIHNLVRGLSPRPAAFTFLNDKRIKIYKTNLLNENFDTQPGKVVIIDNKLLVKCQDKLIQIEELQPEGRKRMHASDFINGKQITSSDIFL